MNDKKICLIVGTRPEIIKMSPVISELKQRNYNYFLINTGQHFSNNMSNQFFKELKIGVPLYNQKLYEINPSRQIGQMLFNVAMVLEKEKPDLVFVQGDTNSTLAGALAANKTGIPVAHIEAGLRSFDKTMPEENNRIMVDHISEYLFTPTIIAAQNLYQEGIREDHYVGNTISDVILNNVYNNVDKKDEILVTFHRPENVDNKDKLKVIFNELKKIDYDIVFPVHPRTKKNIQDVPGNVKLIEPLGYFDFQRKLATSKYVITDSGGLQEESAIIGTPCITVRNNTERPETLIARTNVLAKYDDFAKYVDGFHFIENKYLYGKGNTSQLILNRIERLI